MKVVVTGSRGFVGKNLCVFLRERQHEVLEVDRTTSEGDLLLCLQEADFVFHLAGVNRSSDPREFKQGNVDLTRFIVEILEARNSGVPLVLSSSTQAENDTEYGVSKLAAEEIVRSYSATTGAACYIYRLPNVFGKWSRPHYNSAVATFCRNAVDGVKNTLHDPRAAVTLCYIDDLCSEWLTLLEQGADSGYHEVKNVYHTSVGELDRIISSFGSPAIDLEIERVGSGLVRALYSTYLSFLQPDKFSYKIPMHSDPRGVFCEMLKTKDSGQFSFFTAYPGVVRGGHYHHTKTEKFLVLKGTARFGFKHIVSNEYYELDVSGDEPTVVTTVPGWSHNIANIGTEELVCMLWANEQFDPENPDTFSAEVGL